MRTGTCSAIHVTEDRNYPRGPGLGLNAHEGKELSKLHRSVHVPIELVKSNVSDLELAKTLRVVHTSGAVKLRKGSPSGFALKGHLLAQPPRALLFPEERCLELAQVDAPISIDVHRVEHVF